MAVWVQVFHVVWRGGRAVQCTSLENWRAKALVGSNPTLSVIEEQDVEPTRTRAKPEDAPRVRAERANWSSAKAADRVVRETTEDRREAPTAGQSRPLR